MVPVVVVLCSFVIFLPGPCSLPCPWSEVPGEGPCVMSVPLAV